ncbi:MAG: OmpA family protein [Bacteroides sp.]|jgi:outer membrane protein OmpA-like peptidoglycan-associated protein|nr:OmpA family protein [Bacteroides sp.]
MKTTKLMFIGILSAALLFQGCKALTGTQKGAAVGVAAGTAAGAIIGRASGNTAAGAVVGAAVGGTAGAIIGHQMDKQAEEIREELPDVNVERVGEGIIVEFTNDILFGFDSSVLTDQAMENLDKLVIILNKYPDTDIEILGHTDSSGSNEYNQALSERRAGAVATYLVNQAIAAKRLAIIGFGEEQPKYSNETAEGRAQNRRVEFAITANEKMRQEAEEQATEGN